MLVSRQLRTVATSMRNSLLRPSGTRPPFIRTSGSRPFVGRLFDASRNAPPRTASIVPQALRDAAIVEASLPRATAEADTAATHQGAAMKAEQPVVHATATIPADLSSTARPPAHALDVPTFTIRTNLAGDMRPVQQHRERVHPRAAAAAGTPADRDRGKPVRAHLPRVHAVERSRAPVPKQGVPRPAGTQAVPFAAVHGLGWRLDAKTGKWVEPKKAKKARKKAERRARKAREEVQALALLGEEEILPYTADLGAKAYHVPTAATLPRPAATSRTAFESALNATAPSSLSSVRLSDPLPRAHFARAFAAKREADLAERVLEMDPRGAGSVDLDTAAPTGPIVDIARDVTAVGLQTRLPEMRSPLDGLKARVVAASAPKATPALGVEGAKVKSSAPVEVRIERAAAPKVQQEASEIRPMAQVVAEGRVEQSSPKLVSSPVIYLPEQPRVSHPSLALSKLTAPRFLAELSPWVRDPRECALPGWLRSQTPLSALDRRLRITAQRIWSDIAPNTMSPYVESIAAVERFRVAERARRKLEDRCLAGAFAREEEQRKGRRLEALVGTLNNTEVLVEKYRSYRAGGVNATERERALLDGAQRVDGLLARATAREAFITSETGATSSPSKAILWAGSRPFFVDWDAYIAMYRYGPSRALKELDVLYRREARKLERLAAELLCS